MIKNHRIILIFVILFAPSILCSQNIKTVNSTGARQIINDSTGIIIIDARKASHFMEGHIPGAINIDPYITGAIDKLNELDTSKTHLLYCRTRNRIYALLRIMSVMGFENIILMTDGWVTWSKLGYEAEKPGYE